jgi:hypothetical protein
MLKSEPQLPTRVEFSSKAVLPRQLDNLARVRMLLIGNFFTFAE